MKHEVIIAIIIGFGIGLVITFGIYQAQKIYVDKEIAEIQEVVEPTPTAEAKLVHTLEITSPSNYSLSTSDIVEISGLTSPNAFVTVLSEDNELISQADLSGNFVIETELNPGANVFTVTAIDTQGNQTSEDITISYIESTQEESANVEDQNQDEE